MSRLIDSDLLKAGFEEDGHLSPYIEGFIDACPTVEDKPKWISVEDRLPEDFVDVLVWFEYFRFGSYNRLYRTIGIGSVYNGSWGFINGQSGWQQLKVIAWMPLPEQPKEE